MVSISENCVSSSTNRKNSNKNINQMDGVEEETEDDVVIRDKSTTLLDNSSVELGSPINNVEHITSFLTIQENGDNNLKSYKSNDLWRLDHTTQFKQVQKNSFMHRNLSFRERSVEPVTDQTMQLLKPQRPQSLQVTPSTSSSSSSSSISPFKRESIIRQSWNNIFRKNSKNKSFDKDKNSDKGSDKNDGKKSDKISEQSNLVIEEENVNQNVKNKDKNNNKYKEKGDTDSEMNETLKSFERIPSSLFRKGHSRNSSSSSCASYR